MVGGRSYVVELIAGHRITRCGPAFLVCENDPSIDAKTVFNGLKPKLERLVRSRFDFWLDGGIRKEYFHGWDKADYRDCFFFKWKGNGQNHRFYGFLFHPFRGDPGFQLCVLVSHATKNTWETDPGELDGAKALREEDAVKEAISKAINDINPPLLLPQRGSELNGALD
jgi:hypothetical protein